MTTTTYGTVNGVRYGFTPTETADYVMVTTKTSNLGLYRLGRFGPDPLTARREGSTRQNAHFRAERRIGNRS